YSDTGHLQRSRRLVIEANTPEIDRQIIFETSDDHLENASQILPLADAACDVVQQIHPFQLGMQLPFDSLPPCNIADAAEQPRRLSRFIRHDFALDPHPAHFAILAEDARI